MGNRAYVYSRKRSRAKPRTSIRNLWRGLYALYVDDPWGCSLHERRRCDWSAGIYSSILILMIAKCITLLTGASIAAISTNSEVKGGGAYFLISRSLGPESGGAIGLTLFLAQALSVPFYILGFTEALTMAVPSTENFFELIAYTTTAALLMINLLGAGWAIKAQYFILSALVVSVQDFFLGGALLRFDPSVFMENSKLY